MPTNLLVFSDGMSHVIVDGPDVGIGSVVEKKFDEIHGFPALQPASDVQRRHSSHLNKIDIFIITIVMLFKSVSYMSF